MSAHQRVPLAPMSREQSRSLERRFRLQPHERASWNARVASELRRNRPIADAIIAADDFVRIHRRQLKLPGVR